MTKMRMLIQVSSILLLSAVVSSQQSRSPWEVSGWHGPVEGCRKKDEGNIFEKNVALCISHKPIKPNKASTLSKMICGQGWTMCSQDDKFVSRIISKHSSLSPEGCFGVQFSKALRQKVAGYGKSCHKNLYFDGLLCCPKTKHYKFSKTFAAKKRRYYDSLNNIPTS